MTDSNGEEPNSAAEVESAEDSDMRGRRPKPTRLKVLTGNPGKRPLTKPSLGRSPSSRTAPRSLERLRDENGIALPENLPRLNC